MTIQDRILESEQKFEQEKAKRDEYLKAAEDCWNEMAKLQGEYRILQDILKDEKPNKKATIVEVPEKIK